MPTASSVALALLLCLLPCCASCSPASDALPPDAKRLTLALRDDYLKGDDLEEVAKDFALIRQLGVDELFVNMNWDHGAPAADVFDFDWLHRFIDLAARHDLKLRPYICYKPWWEGDGQWNSPPADLQPWTSFCQALARELQHHPNVLSYEIWLEENAQMWWTGTPEDYQALLCRASRAFRAASPERPIALGGFTHPDYRFLAAILDQGAGDCFDIVPLHCYNETWSDHELEDYFNRGYTEGFLPTLDQKAPGKTVWMSECGYSTLTASERDQANYIARVVPYFLADPASGNRFALFGYYEVKDLPEGSQMIGDDHNYHFGLCRTDRTPKLAFQTYRTLVSLLNHRVVVPADGEVALSASEGSFGRPYHHLLKRADGVQVLFVYDKDAALTASARLTTPGASCTLWNLDATSQPWAGFDGTTISRIALTPGEVRIFEITPAGPREDRPASGTPGG